MRAEGSVRPGEGGLILRMQIEHREVVRDADGDQQAPLGVLLRRADVVQLGIPPHVAVAGFDSTGSAWADSHRAWNPSRVRWAARLWILTRLTGSRCAGLGMRM